MNRIVPIITFVSGAVIGSLVTWKCLKKKYEDIAQDEIDSVKAVYSREYDDNLVSVRNTMKARHEENEEQTEQSKTVIKSAKDKMSVAEYARIIREKAYASPPEDEEETDVVLSDAPYVITPDEFTELYGYDTISLLYFADGILTDDNEEVMSYDDIVDSVGIESLNHFGEYEEDSVYVRNDRLKVDYEICRDLRNYSDVVKAKPYLKPHQIMEE